VARQVEVVEALMAAAHDAGDADEVSYLRMKEADLRKEKADLRKEKADLRKEKADLREEKLLLSRRQSGARVSPQFFRMCAHMGLCAVRVRSRR
jgi:FtsZ-binding cell division protein ZapB